jgi:multiple sugar transport system permease protein
MSSRPVPIRPVPNRPVPIRPVPISRRLVSAGVYALLYSAATLVLLPFVWLVCGAFKKNEDFFGSLFLPTGESWFDIAWSRLTLDNFRDALTGTGLIRAMVNSVFLSSTTAILATLTCAAAGYALAKHQFIGRRWLTSMVLLGVIVPPTLLLAPGYKLLFHLGMLDSYWGLILPAIAPAFGVYLFRQAALNSVPSELIEAARIDGCGDVRIFVQIALPLLRPMVGAFMLITFLGVWNNFITPQVVLQSEQTFPLAVWIAQLRGVYYQNYGLQIAGTLLAIAPVLALFLLLQREFIAGLTSGAVKE